MRPSLPCLSARCRSGLEGQLLGITINHERPQLEHKKSELLAQQDALKIDLARLEKELLEALASSQGDILDVRHLHAGLCHSRT